MTCLLIGSKECRLVEYTHRIKKLRRKVFQVFGEMNTVTNCNCFYNVTH